MPRTTRIRLVLEIDPGSDPIAGAVLEPPEEAGEFRGWLALAALIADLRRDPPEVAGDRTD